MGTGRRARGRGTGLELLGGHFGMLRTLYRQAHDLLNTAHVLALIRRGQRDRVAFAAGPAGPTLDARQLPIGPPSSRSSSRISVTPVSELPSRIAR